MNFNSFVQSVVTLHHGLRRAAIGSANRLLTVRNWLIGHYIVEYEQEGEDRARYGDSVLIRLSEGLKSQNMKGVSVSALRDCRQFYTSYQSFFEEARAAYEGYTI